MGNNLLCSNFLSQKIASGEKTDVIFLCESGRKCAFACTLDGLVSVRIACSRVSPLLTGFPNISMRNCPCSGPSICSPKGFKEKGSAFAVTAEDPIDRDGPHSLHSWRRTGGIERATVFIARGKVCRNYTMIRYLLGKRAESRNLGVRLPCLV